MRNILSTIVLFALTAQAANGQLRALLPELSPDGLVTQRIGYVNFEIRYGRPAARGRRIFGELVPYGKLWRTGAGSGTKLKFDKPVTIGEKLVPAGKYAFVTIPGQSEWVILINSDTTKIYGAPEEYEVKTEMARLKVTSRKTDSYYESLTMEIDIVNNSAEVFVSWENTQVHFPITTSNNEEALSTIETYLSVNSADADGLSYAAFYLRMNHQAPERLLTYLDRALKVKEDWWYYEQKMNLLAEAKRFEEARKVFDTAVNYLHKAKPSEWQTIERNFKESMAKWE